MVSQTPLAQQATKKTQTFWHARCPQNIARTPQKTQLYLPSAPSTRTMSAKVCAQARKTHFYLDSAPSTRTMSAEVCIFPCTVRSTIRLQRNLESNHFHLGIARNCHKRLWWKISSGYHKWNHPGLLWLSQVKSLATVTWKPRMTIKSEISCEFRLKTPCNYRIWNLLWLWLWQSKWLSLANCPVAITSVSIQVQESMCKSCKYPNVSTQVQISKCKYPSVSLQAQVQVYKCRQASAITQV